MSEYSVGVRRESTAGIKDVEVGVSSWEEGVAGTRDAVLGMLSTEEDVLGMLSSEEGVAGSRDDVVSREEAVEGFNKVVFLLRKLAFLQTQQRKRSEGKKE